MRRKSSHTCPACAEITVFPVVYIPTPTPEEIDRAVEEAVDLWDISDIITPAEPVDEMLDTSIRHAIKLILGPRCKGGE